MWKVSIDDIKARNYNLDFKNPNYTPPQPQNPEAIIDGD